MIERATPPAWYTRAWHWATRSPIDSELLDVTSMPGGFAVLVGGVEPLAGRLVDLYDTAGRYDATLRLSSPALRIAGTYDALYVLRQDRDSVLLASYALPRELQRTGIAPGDSVVAPTPAGAPPPALTGLKKRPGRVRK